MEEIEHESIIQWCCQKQYYNDMLSYAKQAVDAYYTNERLRIFLALAYALNNHNKEALKQSSTLVSIILVEIARSIIILHLLMNNFQDSTSEFVDAPLSALIIQSFVHKNQGTAERLVISQIDARIREDRRKASFSTLSLAATVLDLLGKCEKAKEYSDRAYKLDPTDTYVLLAKGWNTLNLGASSDDNPGKD